MFACRKMRGMIAASLYGELSETESAQLHAHLKSCAGCRTEAEVLGALVTALPAQEVEFNGNLLPALKQQLMEAPVMHPHRRWGEFITAVACLALFSVFGYVGMGYYVANGGGEVPVAVELSTSFTPLRMAIANAETCRKDGNLTGAYRILTSAIEAHSDDAAMTDAQVALADLTFSELRWYEDAYEIHRDLLSTPESYDTLNDAEQLQLVRQRWNVLDEARGVGYASLESLERATRSLGDPLEEYGKVVAQYSGTLVASLAVDRMLVAIVEENRDEGLTTRVASLEYALDKSANPMVTAQLKYELSLAFGLDSNSAETVRTLLNDVAVSDAPVLAKLARQSLEEIDAN